MVNFFFRGGHFMYLLLLLAIIILGLTIKKAIDLFGNKSRSQFQLEAGINAIVFWGSISLLVGFFAHFFGLYMAMQAIAGANDISPSIVAEGYGISLITILSGMVIFLLSSIIWFVFRWRIKSMKTKV